MVDKTSSAPRTPYVDPAARLPILVSGTRLHAGLIIALLTVPVVWFLLDRTTIGFRIRTVGLSPSAARAAGMSVAWTTVATMGISGALAGLAGADEVLGVAHYMPPTFTTGYGFDGIAVALLARSDPWAMLPAAFLFGALRSGSRFMQFQTQVPRTCLDRASDGHHVHRHPDALPMDLPASARGRPGHPDHRPRDRGRGDLMDFIVGLPRRDSQRGHATHAGRPWRRRERAIRRGQHRA